MPLVYIFSSTHTNDREKRRSALHLWSFHLFELLIFKSLEDELYYLKFIYSVNGMDAFESVTPLP